MARRQHHNSISLFPFLAVLVCAMGSLILLLLVMTRKIRNDQRFDSAAIAVAAVAAPLPDRSAELAALKSQLAEQQQQLEDNEQQLAAVAASVSAREQRIVVLTDELAALRQQLAGVKTADLTAAAENTQADLDRLNSQEADLRAQLTEREAELMKQRQMLAATKQSVENATRVLHEKNSAIVSLRAQLKQTDASAAVSDGTRTLLEFTNPTGTVRTPITINVSDAGYELLPNGPLITPGEMEGFPVRDNPLLSAVVTAHRFRSKDSVVDEPYVLLLVRPDGCLPFYGAQRILTEARIHHGYELLLPEKKIVVDPVDASEVPLVRAAISDALQRRNQLYSKLLAMAQAGANGNGSSGRSTGSSSQPNKSRGLTIRPNGRVTENLGGDQSLPGRFYAGGVAPPSGHLRHRPPGGYGNVPRDSLTVVEAEQLADEFARQYAERRDAGRTQGNNPSSLPTRVQDTGTEPATADAQPQSASNTSAAEVDPLTAMMTQPSDHTANPQADETKSFVPMSPEEAFFMRSQTASTRNDAAVQRLTDSGLRASGNGDASLAGDAGPDISRADPDLLARLQKPEHVGESLASPVSIVVFLDERHLTISQQPTREISTDQLQAALAALLQGINTEVEDARRDPREPLMPIVKFVVSPGGERWRIPLARELRSIGIHSATIYELSPYVVVVDQAGHARVEGVAP